MSKVNDLERRIEQLEIEVKLLRELLELRGRVNNPTMPLSQSPWYQEHEYRGSWCPPYKITCKDSVNE